MDRINEPEKHWKFSANDVRERRFWDDYQRAYTQALQHTSTQNSPWFVIPADKKWFTRVAVSEIICQRLEALDLHYPKVSQEQLDELQKAKIELENE